MLSKFAPNFRRKSPKANLFAITIIIKMKKQLKSVLSALLIAAVSCVTAHAAPTFRLEVKSKQWSKQTTSGLNGVIYTEGVDNGYYTNDTWPLIECYYDYNYGISGYLGPDGSTYRHIKQFGVSKGVVYWQKPTTGVLCYWNTVTGEVGTLTPTKDKWGNDISLVGKTGYGSVTQDWAGNLVHAWNTAQDAPIQGFAVYRAPETYGTLINPVPVVSDMTTSIVGYLSGSVGTDLRGGTVAPETDAWIYTANPNIATADVSTNGNPTGTQVCTHYLAASYNLFDKKWGYSRKFSGWEGGFVWVSYGATAFGSVLADGVYANWYLDYDLKRPPYYQYPLTTQALKDNISANYVSTLNAESGNYLKETLFRESTIPFGYLWSIPNTGIYEHSKTNQSGEVAFYMDLIMPVNYMSTYNYQRTDMFSAPVGDSIQNFRVLITNTNYNCFAPDDDAKRDGSFAIHHCDFALDDVQRMSGYSTIGSGYGFRHINNGTATTNFDGPLPGSALSCWNELERVNANVQAYYTFVPGRGFSKYFITAVAQDNPVSGASVARICHDQDASIPVDEDKIKVKVTWTAQTYDRATLNRYEVWYQTFKRDENGNLVTDCNDTWTKAGVASIDYSDGNYTENRTGTFIHEEVPYGTNEDGTTYDVTYKYMIIPIYDASDHRGTESIIASTVTSSAPRTPVDATLTQQTESSDLGTKYSFNLQLDVTTNANLTIPMSDANAHASISRYVVVAEDEATAAALAQATSVECSGATATVGTGTSNVFSAHNCNHHTATGYYVDVTGFTAVNAAGTALPTIVWHNVNPDVTYKVKVYAVADRNYNFVETAEVTGTMYVPVPELVLQPASFYKFNNDYSSLAEDADQPMGSRLLYGSSDVTNPVALNNANYLGTNGSVIKPLMVTDEVLGTYDETTGTYSGANWDIAYTVYLYNGDVTVAENKVKESQFYGQNSEGYGAMYSNTKNVTCDFICLPVGYDEVEAPDGSIRKIYNAAKNLTDHNAVVRAHYRRTSAGIDIYRDGTAPLTVTTENPFEKLDINGAASPAALFYQSGTHFYYNGVDDEGYYPVYYNATVQFTWSDYVSSLNRYVGFYGESTVDCYGHYVNSAATTWTRFLAGSAMTNAQVADYNSRDASQTFLNGINYDGTSETNWSALSTDARQLPMLIHYVWGGNSKLETDEERTAVKFNVELTADYPMIVRGTTTLIVAEDPSTYEVDPSNSAYSMDVISVPNTMDNINAESLVNNPQTSVEGILVNACGGVKLYPNPVSSTFTLQAPMTINNVKIFTTDGQLVKVVKGLNDTTVKINVDELPQGMYIVNTLGTSQIMVKL